EANNNPDFKVRVRFGGSEVILQSNSGNVRFNNVSLSGFTGDFEEPGEEGDLIHYWVFDESLPNNKALETINPVYTVTEGGRLAYSAAVSPYPPENSGTDGILDRVNDPTMINYISSGNSNISYLDSEMRGIRARNPSLVDGKESYLIFDLPSTGYEALAFRFAAKRTGTGQETLIVEYSTSREDTVWSRDGLNQSEFALFETYKTVDIRFKEIADVNNNRDLKVRVRFGGSEEIRTSNSGNVRFNNFSLSGFPGNFEEPEDADNLIHYWVFDDDLPNNTPLEFIDATYSELNSGMIEYISAISPYPPADGTAGILDRVNDPTMINYFPSGNNNITFSESAMRGLRARNPSLTEHGESALVIHLPTTGFIPESFSFAASRTGSGQEKLILSYSVSEGNTEWIDDDLEQNMYDLFLNYHRITIPVEDIHLAENNPDFKIRIRFGGSEEIREGDSGNVRFNNFALRGEEIQSVSPPELPSEVKLEQNFPNPFNPVTVINFALPSRTDVTLSVYDAIGRRVATLVDEQLNPGMHTVTFDGSQLSSGVYLYRLNAGGVSMVLKMTLIK
ncbi:MAG: T9SS C-terminal target domain-containing protein, partial [Balneolaceae bacterium]